MNLVSHPWQTYSGASSDKRLGQRRILIAKGAADGRVGLHKQDGASNLGEQGAVVMSVQPNAVNQRRQHIRIKANQTSAVNRIESAVLMSPSRTSYVPDAAGIRISAIAPARSSTSTPSRPNFYIPVKRRDTASRKSPSPSCDTADFSRNKPRTASGASAATAAATIAAERVAPIRAG